MKTLNVALVVLVTCWQMGNATLWKADYDEPDGKCLISRPDPKNKDGKPIMVWVDCDWRGGHLVTRATTTTVKPSTTTIPIITRPPGKCLAKSDVYKYKNGEPAWVWVECDYTSGRPKPITKKPATTAKPASPPSAGSTPPSSPRPSMSSTTPMPRQQSTSARPVMNPTTTPPPRNPSTGSTRPPATATNPTTRLPSRNPSAGSTQPPAMPLVTQTMPPGVRPAVNATTQPVQG